MTEEIIVDGVNVAGCISFDKNNGHNICCYDDTREDKIPFANFCVENKNCYYKQLKHLQEKYDTLTNKFFNSETDKTRLEQENKELRKANEISIEKITVTAEAKRLQELEQENEELKRENENRNDWITSLNKKCGELIEEKLNYRTALEEIREAVKTNLDAGILISGGWIEQKIDEVLNPHN